MFLCVDFIGLLVKIELRPLKFVIVVRGLNFRLVIVEVL